VPPLSPAHRDGRGHAPTCGSSIGRGCVFPACRRLPFTGSADVRKSRFTATRNQRRRESPPDRLSSHTVPSPLGGTDLGLHRRRAAVDWSGHVRMARGRAHGQDGAGVPTYFGENWPALDDCLTDMAWLPPEVGYVLVLTEPLRDLGVCRVVSTDRPGRVVGSTGSGLPRCAVDQPGRRCVGAGPVEISRCSLVGSTTLNARVCRG